MISIAVKTAIMLAVLCIQFLFPKRKELIKSFSAGFCIAQGVAGLCGKCAWMYSVVFGELFGLGMLSVTVTGAMGLFYLLSDEKGNLLLTAMYVFFSSCENEYAPHKEPIINSVSHGARLGCVGIGETGVKRLILMVSSSLAGQVTASLSAQIPASFAAISCCALLCAGIKKLDGDTSRTFCCIGAVTACLLSYL